MSAPKPLEIEYLAPAERVLTLAIQGHGNDPFEMRLQMLEACSARFGGFDLHEYHVAFGIKPQVSARTLLELANPVASAIEQTAIHPAFALSALAREALQEHDRKTTGAYHTDFRLAGRIAELATPSLTHGSKVIDPACGAGILLVALTIAVCGRDRAKTSVWLAQGVYAADLSRNSLRAALLSLASFTDDIDSLKVMRGRWLCGDSLMTDPKIWKTLAPKGFDAVVGNPPWGKVKLSRHHFLKSSGKVRHYGDRIENLDERSFNAQRNKVASYSQQLLLRYPFLGPGEPDLYIAFTQLFFELCKNSGVVAALIPGGLIRSKGTRVARERLIDASSSVSLSILDNRARFFAIDTRFKFLAMALVKTDTATSKREPIKLLHERGTAAGLEVTGSATLGRSALRKIRPDLSLPEVRSAAEWKVYRKACAAGTSWNEPGSGWAPKFCREVDMTKERSKFLDQAVKGALPLVEGRMVHAHRFGVKGHASGTGRRAIWEPHPIGASRLNPQFWIASRHVPAANKHRTDQVRVGFCDIAGQTNERSLLASLIPSGVVCGNKVPTILFPEDPGPERLLVWLAIANSFAFDWMLRRVLTTTVNYFLLQSVPLPRLAKGGLPWQNLLSFAAELRELDQAGATSQTWERIAQVRGEIDAEVAMAYGLGLSDVELMLRDFPILDRGQPALPGESKSTITRDTVLAAVAHRYASRAVVWSQRTADAQELGAVAFVPSQLALGVEETKVKGLQVNG